MAPRCVRLSRGADRPMLVDKKFWSGALIVVTVVVAGAGTLPGLLLRPTVSEAPDLPVAVSSQDSVPPNVVAPPSAVAAADPAPATPPVLAKPAEPLPSKAAALPVATEQTKRAERPAAAE